MQSQRAASRPGERCLNLAVEQTAAGSPVVTACSPGGRFHGSETVDGLVWSVSALWTWVGRWAAPRGFGTPALCPRAAARSTARTAAITSRLPIPQQEAPSTRADRDHRPSCSYCVTEQAADHAGEP